MISNKTGVVFKLIIVLCIVPRCCLSHEVTTAIPDNDTVSSNDTDYDSMIQSNTTETEDETPDDPFVQSINHIQV